MTRENVWHDSFKCVPCIIHVCGMPHSYEAHAALIYEWTISLIHLCDMSPSCAWRDSSIHHSFIHDCHGATHSCAAHANFMCVTRCIDMGRHMHICAFSPPLRKKERKQAREKKKNTLMHTCTFSPPLPPVNPAHIWSGCNSVCVRERDRERENERENRRLHDTEPASEMGLGCLVTCHVRVLFSYISERKNGRLDDAQPMSGVGLVETHIRCGFSSM